MDKYVLILGLFFADHKEVHAKGLFSTQVSCERFGAIVSRNTMVQNLYMCVTEETFRAAYTGVRMNEDS